MSAHAYDATIAMLAALHRQAVLPGIDSAEGGDAVMAALLNVTFDGATGKVGLDELILMA